MNDPVAFQFVVSRRQARVLLAALVLLSSAYAVRSEGLRLMSYYPSPSGVYRKLVTTMDTVLASESGRVLIGKGRGGEKLDVGAGTLVVADGRVGVGGAPASPWTLDVRGPATFNGHRLSSIGSPLERADAASKGYVDDSVSPLAARVRALEETVFELKASGEAAKKPTAPAVHKPMEFGCGAHLIPTAHSLCTISGVVHNDRGRDSDFRKAIIPLGSPDAEGKRRWQVQNECANDRSGSVVTCVDF